MWVLHPPSMIIQQMAFQIIWWRWGSERRPIEPMKSVRGRGANSVRASSCQDLVPGNLVLGNLVPGYMVPLTAALAQESTKSRHFAGNHMAPSSCASCYCGCSWTGSYGIHLALSPAGYANLQILDFGKELPHLVAHLFLVLRYC